MNIELTRGFSAIIDDEDAEKVQRHSWCVLIQGRNIYAQSRILGKAISLHKFIFDKPIPKSLILDHKNRNGLDNRKSNLRLSTRSQNGVNTRAKRPGAASKYRGVWFCRKTKKWGVNIRVNKKVIWLGRFETEEEAGKVYIEASQKFHGEFCPWLQEVK
jgi:hypothetical protein